MNRERSQRAAAQKAHRRFADENDEDALDAELEDEDVELNDSDDDAGEDYAQPRAKKAKTGPKGRGAKAAKPPKAPGASRPPLGRAAGRTGPSSRAAAAGGVGEPEAIDLCTSESEERAAPQARNARHGNAAAAGPSTASPPAAEAASLPPLGRRGSREAPAAAFFAARQAQGAGQRLGRRGSGAPPDPPGNDAGDAGAGPSQAPAPTQTARQARAAAGPPLQIDRQEVAAFNSLVRACEEQWKEAKEKCPVYNQIAADDVRRLGGAVLRFMVLHETKEPGVPVARHKLAEAVAAAFKTHKHHRKMGSLWLPLARYLAAKELGMELVELDRKAAGGPDALPPPPAAAAVNKKDDPGSNRYYVLRSALPSALRAEFIDFGDDPAPWALTLTVLALIKLNSDKLDEDVLLRYLSQLGVDADSPHPVLGKLGDQLKAMEHRRYIVAYTPRQGVGAGDGPPPARVFSWGEAARSDFARQEVEAFINEQFTRLEQITLEGGAAGGGNGNGNIPA